MMTTHFTDEFHKGRASLKLAEWAEESLLLCMENANE